MWKCKHEASVDLPKFLVVTCSCLACPLFGVGPYGWWCSLMESSCAVSLIVVGSFTLFTVGCGCIVNWVLCLLCGWIFHCVLCGAARHLYCWSGCLQCRVLTLPRAYCVICTMYAASCSIRVVVYSAHTNKGTSKTGTR